MFDSITCFRLSRTPIVPILSRYLMSRSNTVLYLQLRLFLCCTQVMKKNVKYQNLLNIFCKYILLNSVWHPGGSLLVTNAVLIMGLSKSYPKRMLIEKAQVSSPQESRLRIIGYTKSAQRRLWSGYANVPHDGNLTSLDTSLLSAVP